MEVAPSTTDGQKLRSCSGRRLALPAAAAGLPPAGRGAGAPAAGPRPGPPTPLAQRSLEPRASNFFGSKSRPAGEK